MAPFALPLIKLSALFLKQVSKPVASRLKVEAQKSRRMHSVLCRLGMKPLPVEEALTTGITFVSESIVIFIAGSLATYEYTKSVQNGMKKEEKLSGEFKSIRDRLTSLEARLDKMEQSKIKFKEILRETQRKEREKDLLDKERRASTLAYQAWLAYGRARKYIGEVWK